MNMIGEIAGLSTAIAWSFTSIFFTIAARSVGAVAVNRIRLLLATVLLITLHVFLYKSLLPIHAGMDRWFWLGLSALIGLVFGDTMLFQAFVVIGTRISMLLMSLVPIISTITAWIFLNEILTMVEIFAIMLTIGGIIWVVLERNNGNLNLETKKYIAGVLFGLGGATGQALGLIAAKKALGGDFPALSATLIRILVATIIFWTVGMVRQSFSLNFRRFFLKKNFYPILGGSFFGPFIGIWLSLIAIKYANIGIASTLMALPPIFLLPLTYWIFKEKVSLRTIVGTMMAVSGVALIFLI